MNQRSLLLDLLLEEHVELDGHVDILVLLPLLDTGERSPTHTCNRGAGNLGLVLLLLALLDTGEPAYLTMAPWCGLAEM